MKAHERALQELRDWTIAVSGGLQILFAAHNPSIVGGVPHPWQCTASNGRQTKELYHAYGITFEDAVIKCHQRFIDQKAGYDWESVDDVWFMSPKQWFDYQQNK